MNRNEITVRFAELTDQMEQVNTSLKTKRFYAIQEYRNGKLFDFGMYDSARKKYVICNVSATDAENALSEIQSMVNQS